MAAGFAQRVLKDVTGNFKGLFWLADTSAPTTTDSIPAHVEYDPVNNVKAFGEVQASPTANTLLDRAKTVGTNLGATSETAAANPSATAGLNGVIKGMWTGLVAGIGAIGDTAWSGTGNGSAVAILKTIATQVLSTAAQAVLPALTAASNGLTASRVNSAASTNATSLKASAGNIGDIDVFNNAAYAVFLKLYNKASSPTVGTDTPVWTIPIAAGSGFSRAFPRGRSFATGIAYAITKLQADSDTTAVAAGDLTGSIGWI